MSGVLATYRLQLHAGFTFADVRPLIPYLHDLGITHLYLSPILRARAGSRHGYDVVDPAQLNPELGTEAGFERVVADLRAREMGLILDIVPNHMATGHENPYWDDVLAHGRSSPYARWFDIDWEGGAPPIRLPVLGEPAERALQEGKIDVVYQDGRFRVAYGEQTFPLDPATVPGILDPSTPPPGREADLARLAELAQALEHLPSRGPVPHPERRESAHELLGSLQQLYERSAVVRAHVASAIGRARSSPAGARALRRVLRAQEYRLDYWRSGERRLNYRRFFTISDLIAVRQEDPSVFAATHDRVLRYVERGLIDGLRIDHVDGLADPAGYLVRLRDAIRRARPRNDDFSIFVEKILARDEALPASWPVEGTTGYDFLNQVEDLFIDPDGYASLEDRYRSLSRRRGDFATVAAQAKREILAGQLAPDVRRVAALLVRVGEAEGDRGGDRKQLAGAIVETIAFLPVYRTYVDGAYPAMAAADRRVLSEALAKAREGGRASAAALDMLARVMLPAEDHRSGQDPGKRLAFVQRFQQLGGPAAAKGIEDTALYRWVPLGSRNEVGGEPAHPLRGAVPGLHTAAAARTTRWPHTMLCVSTHDTKRTADLRARLDVLSEMPARWHRSVLRWRRHNHHHRRRASGRSVPGFRSESLLYQTLVGVWPLHPIGRAALPDESALADLADRVAAYMLKAEREAKIDTDWLNRNSAYEHALDGFVHSILGHDNTDFLRALDACAARVGRIGLWNALARTATQLTSPGIPDVYQGDEVWNLGLVDPDNRRPVDFDGQRALLAGLPDNADSARAVELLTAPQDGRLKLYVTQRILRWRLAAPELFRDGAYLPLAAEGPAAHHVFAFARQHVGGASVTLVPRLIAPLVGESPAPPTDPGLWSGTVVRLPPALATMRWVSALTGDEVRSGAAVGALPVDRALAVLPVAVLGTV